MIDATASCEGNSLTAAMASQRALPDVSAAVLPVSAEAVSAYSELCRTGLYAPAQSASWIGNWIAEVKPDHLIASLNAEGRTVFSLALEVVRRGPFRVARFMGGRHANGNFPAVDACWAEQANALAFEALAAAVAKTRPDIDLIALERLLPELGGTANPLACLKHFSSPDLSLAVDLHGGFDALLLRASGKRKRKKHRSQTRKFETAGGFRRFEARTTSEVGAMLDAFFAMKEARFRKMGVVDVFGKAPVRAFFHSLFSEALKTENPPFVLHGLEVAGKLRAVTGSSLCGTRLICEFGSIAEDDLGYTSPGDFLFFDNIKEACDKGFSVYDFSVGDEPYKRLWCDLETQNFDVLMPLTLKGRALSMALHQSARAKAFIKNSPAIWKLTKTLRRKTVGQAPAAAEDEN